MSIANYPTALKEFGKWDAAAQQRMAALMQINDSVVAIANQSTSRAELLRKATPLLEKADKISGDLARSAGFWYHKDDGCGAGIEDSQRVSFSFSEKPRAAYYISQIDFDICKQASVNPDDPQKCDNWEQINAKGNPLSGNYRYLVVWLDGSVKEHSFKALSTGAKTIEITK
jgi:hypothetical protein